MSYNYKLTDLKYRINGLVPKNICDSFINLYKDNESIGTPELSFKYKDLAHKQDNFNSINLSELSLFDDRFKKPLEIAETYIGIVISNYVFHIQKEICPTFNNVHIQKTNNIRILRYNVGECIEDHSDIDGHIRGSCTLNLNEDYEGGEFRFFDGQIKEVFKTGDAMLFPAEPIWIHGTEPITKGTRYSINCFLHSIYT
tara:strand:+ start:452 stop:1048 length:597 start_codon:yes stop_codon:yes gene_type:complete